MQSVRADRRLVKSPPELWAEVSDPEALARRLGELGEIRITRVEPETEVAWEAEHASGTIEIESSGWGTRVCLSAVPASPPQPEPATPVPPPERVETELRTVGEDVIPIEIPAPAPAPAEPPKPGLLARWLGRRRATPAPEPPPPPERLELRVVHAACASRVPERPVTEAAPESDDGLDTEALRQVLDRVLDVLGAAHHRPFSRG